MKYAYYDLGDVPAGRELSVNMSGSAANVILLDPRNFASYRRGKPFFYAAGGHCRRTPIQLTVPENGHWYLVLDTGGFRGRVRGTVRVFEEDGPRVVEAGPAPVAVAD
jgi:hypothetical protein